MRICYLADAGSIHTKRWCDYFGSLGHEIHLVSFREGNVSGVKFHLLDGGKINVSGGNWSVLLQFRKLKKNTQGNKTRYSSRTLCNKLRYCRSNEWISSLHYYYSRDGCADQSEAIICVQDDS